MDIFKYAEDIILSMGGNGADVEQITEEIKESGYTTIEEVKSHLENYYIQEEAYMKVDMFTHSEWFGNDIYVSSNDNIYCLYSFDNGLKLLIIDEDMKFEQYKNIIEGIEELNEMQSDVMIYWMYCDKVDNSVRETIRAIVAEYEENPKKFFKKYNTKDRNQIGGIDMKEYKVKLNMSEEYNIEANSKEEAEKIARDKFGNDYLIDDVEVKETNKKKEMKTVTPAKFITAWNDMEKYWANNDGDNDENSYYNRIINQPINIELPLLGIKTELFWCPPTVECLDDMFKRMIEDTYFDLLVEKEDCFNTSGGIWLAEVPFEYGDKSLVMVVNNEDSTEWAIYQNVLKNNGKYESVEYDELMEFTGNANNILPDFQIYYIRALQLLADR